MVNSNRIEGQTAQSPFIGIYDQQDRLIRFNTTTFNYNPNGEMISKTNLIKLDFKKRRPIYETTSMQYDVFGNLVKHGKVSYKIDPLNKRLARLIDGVTTNMYAYNPEGQMIAELDQSGRLSKYFVYGSKSHVPDYFIDSNNEKFKIITDHLGSVRYVVNSSTGEVKLKMNHDEFGKVLVDTNPNYLPFGFAGGIYDSATGLVRFGVRDYDPSVGRWASKDPILFGGKMTNLYGYSFLDPVNFIDPSGLAPGDSFGSEAGAGYDAIKYINAASIYHNQEFAGTIYRNGLGGYSYTVPRWGGAAGANPGPISANTTAIYHTHAGYDPRYDNENFSPTDTRFSTGRGLGSYLGTPFGSIQYQGPNGNTTNMSGPNSCGR